MHIIVWLFVLLDLDWLARDACQGWHVPHCKRYNVVQYKIVFLQILLSLASHGGYRFSLVLTRCYNSALIPPIYNLTCATCVLQTFSLYLYLYTYSLHNINCNLSVTSIIFILYIVSTLTHPHTKIQALLTHRSLSA